MEFVFAQADSSLTLQVNVFLAGLDAQFVLQTPHALNVLLH
jgi:hypothetical protein